MDEASEAMALSERDEPARAPGKPAPGKPENEQFQGAEPAAVEETAPPASEALPLPVGERQGEGGPEVDNVAPPESDAISDRLERIIESVLFAAGTPVSLRRLVEILDGPTTREVLAAVRRLLQEYALGRRGIQLREVAGGYQFRTARENAEWVRAVFREKPSRLGRATLETLAVVAYKQPVTRAEIEAVRGVDVDGVLSTLLSRRLIKIEGRKETVGRPLLYGTTAEFLEVFGLKDLNELPSLKELGPAPDTDDEESSPTPSNKRPPGTKRSRSQPRLRVTPTPQQQPTATQRLQKILSQAGIASRRKAEELIQAGRVRLNGRVVTELGTKADPRTDRITIDGRPLRLSSERLYILLHKPVGVVTTLSDPEGRPTVRDLLPEVRVRVFPVGRLDYYSSGLLLLTNDGELALRLTHPRYGVRKTYQVKVNGRPTAEALEKLASGVRLEEGTTAPAEVRVIRGSDAKTWLEITLSEGRKREVRRMCEQVGYRVEKLTRIRLGPLNLGSLQPGQHRTLTEREVYQLRHAVGLSRVRALSTDGTDERR